MLTMMCTRYLTPNGSTAALESSALSSAYAAVQVFHFSESKDKDEADVQDVNKEDDVAQHGQLPAGTLQSQASDKKIS